VLTPHTLERDRPSLPRRARAAAIAVAVLLVVSPLTNGCSRSATVARAFEPGTRMASREGVEVSLVGATWHDRGVTLRLEVAALDGPVTLPMRNVMLVYEDLAYPLQPVPGGPWPSTESGPEGGKLAVLRVDPGMSARVTGYVDLGRALRSPAVLRVHGLPSALGDADAVRLEIEVPATPNTAPPPGST
jgi:hypothetical protein